MTDMNNEIDSVILAAYTADTWARPQDVIKQLRQSKQVAPGTPKSSLHAAIQRLVVAGLIERKQEGSQSYHRRTTM